MVKHRILIVDDHQIIIDGIEKIIQGEPDFYLLPSMNNGKEALNVINSIEVDVVVMDLDMPIMDGVEATRRIKKINPDIKVIILTMHNSPSVVKDLMKLGADAYLLKNSNKEVFVSTLRKVLNNEKYFQDVHSGVVTKSTESLTSSFEDKVKISDLTEREIEILKLICEGFSNKEIGEQLKISHRTVDTHRTNLMKKVEANNVASLIKFAFKNGLIS